MSELYLKLFFKKDQPGDKLNTYYLSLRQNQRAPAEIRQDMQSMAKLNRSKMCFWIGKCQVKNKQTCHAS